MSYIKSPINYTGNKYRLLPQFEQFFPKKTGIFVDLFCGGATVGSNVDAEQVIFIDSNERVVELLQYMAITDFSVMKEGMEDIIEKYHLSYSAKNGYSYYYNLMPPENRNNGLKAYNSKGFYELRSDYNSMIDKHTAEAQLKLYMLMVYGFNNDLRFNKNGEYNLPAGKTDLNSNNLRKIQEFSKRAKERNFVFINGDFRSREVQDVLFKADFVYSDPPYLITCAVYNESDGWNENKEEDLLMVYSDLLNNDIDLAFSNVLCRGDVVNKPLKKWIGENENNIKVHRMEYDYISSSYNKKNRYVKDEEILVRG